MSKKSRKAIPKKPKYVEVEREGMDMETGELYTYHMFEALCGRCNGFIGFDEDIDFNYCPYCGQKINKRSGME